tara:strand:+ start:579 stop:854 length:276 start_codon:yes stop_codon:yes gene_type:complete
MWELTKQYWKDMWNTLWSKTTIDEKAIATLEEIQKRYKLTAKELADVGNAIKQVGNQIDDIPAALKGKKRKGRKTNMGKNAQNPINMNSKK